MPASTSSAVILLSTSTCGVHLLPPPNPPRFATYDFSETGEMTVNNTNPKQRKSTKMPTSGRLLSTTNHSMYLEDDPYSSEDDDIGITSAVVDGNQIDEFEETKLGGKKRREWTSEMETVRGFNKVGEKELFSVFRNLSLNSLKISYIDPKTRTMFPSLTSLDVSSNSISDISNLPPTLISFSAYNNSISSLFSTPNIPDLMLLGLGYNPIADNLSVLPSRVPNLISLDLGFCDLTDLDSTLLSLSTFSALRHLCLRGNPLSLLPNYTFKTTSTLDQLNMLDDVPIDREPVEEEPQPDKLNYSENISIKCSVNNVKGIPIWGAQESEEDEGGKGKKGDKKDKDKPKPKDKGKGKGKGSTASLQAPDPVNTTKCWLQVTLKGVQHDFKQGGEVNNDVRIADTEHVAWSPTLWGELEENEEDKSKSAKGGKKDKKGKNGEVESVEDSSVPPPKNEGVMELKFKPSADVRDAAMFGGLELVLWRVQDEKKYEVFEEEGKDNDNEEKKNDAGESKDAEDSTPADPPAKEVTTVSKDKMGRVLSTSISTSIVTRQESGMSMRKNATRTTAEVARGTIDLKHFLEQGSLNKYGEGKLELKGVLTINDGFVQVEKDRINAKIKEKRKKEKEEEGVVEGEEEEEEEVAPDWQPEGVGVVDFDFGVSWNELVKEPEIKVVQEGGRVK